MEDDTESFWLFIKWVAIDIVFMFGLPELRIPWLEWSSTAITVPFLLHAVLNGMLMFRIPVSSTSKAFSLVILKLMGTAPDRRMAAFPYQNSL